MKYLILLLLIITVIGGGFFVYQKVRLPDGQVKPTKPESSQSAKITDEQAAKIVTDFPEVKKYLEQVPNGKVVLEGEEGEQYLIHVYEIKDGHTATFNWYRVNFRDGKVVAEFDVE